MNEAAFQLKDRYLKGNISRREFLRAATLLGMSLTSATTFLAACGPTAQPTQAPQVEATVVPESQPTEAPQTPTPEVPTVGGTLVYGMQYAPNTLDPHKTTSGYETRLAEFIGSKLLMVDPNGDYVGYLADSWKSSPDGLTWDFVVKKGVKFHDGTPFTAKDFEWSIQRILDPEFQAGGVKAVLGPVESAQALDEYTLRINLKTPYYPILYGLSTGGYVQPVPRSAVERLGDEFGLQPVGVGPYKFKEWRTGEKVVLERNPDYSWGPSYAHKGPPYIQTIEFRFIPETETMMAGLEAGEIDHCWGLLPKDAKRIEETGKFQVFTTLHQGINPFVGMNVSRPPFDDVRVRQAFNLAVDKQALIDIVALGTAEPQYGPVSPAVAGYWPGVEEIGYRYDLEKAKALMEEAGWVDTNGDGIREKDGKPLKLTLTVDSGIAEHIKTAEVMQAQYKALGADIAIEKLETGMKYTLWKAGDYDLNVTYWNYSEVDILYITYHSSNVGVGYNLAQVKDPVLDEILARTRAETDPDKRQQAANEAQKYIIEQAIIVPLYASKTYTVVNKRVKGVVYSDRSWNPIYWDDAYIEAE